MSVQTKPSSEKVIPLSAKDQWRPISNIRSLAFIVVRDILDGEFMKESLEKLVKEHIPLLSSRIKPSRTDGWLQYHLTSPLPDNYDIFGWSVSNVGTTIGESKLVPEKSSQKGITILPDVTALESCWIPADWPILRNQDKPETPLLLVHLTYYTDATIVAVSLPHCVSDQLGLGSVISSWTDLMQDKELVPFIDLPEGALEGDKTISKKELHKKYEFRLKTKADRAGVLMGIVPELVRRSKETRCTLYFPVEVINGILRGFHPSLPKSHKYLHNALVFAPTHAAISRSKPAASEIAYRTRLAIVQSLQPANMERGLAVARELYLHNILMHICEPWEFSYGVTNWCNAWHGIDFSAASIRRAEQGVEKMDEGDGAVPAPLVFGHALERNHPNRLIATIMSKGEGGYWVDFAAPNKGMEAIKALLRNDPNLETI
ncbi:acetyltransferase adrJ [Trichoderma asperellum]|uniref:Acetyltransferase adrJ n=1 Tax=Trichoderma asperellum TaxID=101201 RepID=A0A6V8R6H3_TRIAP|nr:acetyltransferase adrJ [Trichoderma asperellum]